MRGQQHPLLKCVDVEGAGFSARLTFNQRSANSLKSNATFLFTSDQVSDVFTVVGVIPSVNLRFNPTVLLVSQSDGLAHSSHGGASQYVQ